MGSITFDRFDGGLLLARPSSVAPANSLAELMNMDVQPGGWLRSRPIWRRVADTLTPGSPYSIANNFKGLESNFGFLWVFSTYNTGAVSGYATLVDGTKICFGNSNHGLGAGGGAPEKNVLMGTTRWQSGFVVTWRVDDVSTTSFVNVLHGLTLNAAGVPTAFPTSLITDVNMPKSGVTVTLGNRIYAVSDDGLNVRFSAVGSATDWTTAGNAGFLPVSQHFASGQKVYALGVYQGKLAVFTDQSIQLWTVDPDPTAMALDRTMDGIGTRHHKSIVSLNGDLLFLSESGVRSITTISSSLFPSDVDVGLPVKSAMASPTATLIAGGGSFVPAVTSLAATPFAQYWIAAPGAWNIGDLFPLTNGWYAWSYSKQGKLNAWARHGAGGNDRAKIYGWATVGKRVYMRNDLNDYLNVMTPDVFGIEQTDASFAMCSVLTEWLDFKLPGHTKSITGLDFDGKNVQSISVLVSAGGDRSGITADTIAVGSNQAGWTYSGEILPVNAAGTEFRLYFSGAGTQEVQINRITVYFDDLGR